MAADTSTFGSFGQEVSTADKASYISGAEANNLKPKGGKVSHVVVSGDDSGTGASLIIYDNNASDATHPRFKWVTADGKGTFPLQMPMQNGIRVVTAGTPPTNGGWTVMWS